MCKLARQRSPASPSLLQPLTASQAAAALVLALAQVVEAHGAPLVNVVNTLVKLLTHVFALFFQLLVNGFSIARRLYLVKHGVLGG